MREKGGSDEMKDARDDKQGGKILRREDGRGRDGEVGMEKESEGKWREVKVVKGEREGKRKARR